MEMRLEWVTPCATRCAYPDDVIPLTINVERNY